MGIAVLRFLPCVLTHFPSWRPATSVCHCSFHDGSRLDPLPDPHSSAGNEKCGKSLAPMDEFCFQAPDSFAERQSNSQRHLLPPHPDAQLMWAWHALIYGGWAWLTMFFQSYTGSSMKNSQQQQPKLDSKISSMWTLAEERFYHCRSCYPKRLSIYNHRRSPSAKETWVLWGPAGTAVATYTLL